MDADIGKRKDAITRYLKDVLSEGAQTLAGIHPMGEQMCKKLLEFSTRGKMLRGGLVGVGYELYAEADEAITVPLGAVQELFQSALLIHDDIMDRDMERRGVPSLLGHYVSLAEGMGLQDAYHTGEALSICAGDIAYFFAFDVFSRIPLEAELKSRLLSICARELSFVGVAQMVDVVWGADGDAVSIDDIIHMYTYKTARYTYALPLVAGAVAAGGSDEEVAILERLGTHMGVLFQLKDDELGIFGDQEKLGKPVGSDIREGKKTLYHHFLMNDPDKSIHDKVRSMFGRKEMSIKEVEFVRKRIQELGIQEKIEEIARKITAGAEEDIAALACDADRKELLSGLLFFNSTREK